MFQTVAYLAQPHEDIVRLDVDLLVTGCGHYRLLHQPLLHTGRPDGRADYQLLYLAGGGARFIFDGREVLVEEGGAVLYRPGMPQDYYYSLADGTDVYWVHFTGRGVERILSEAGMEGVLFRVRPRALYPELFDGIIRELQLKRTGYSSVCAGKAMELLSRIGRSAADGGQGPDSRMEDVLAFFHQNFQEEIQVRECARRFNMSESWLIRCFRQRTGMTPQRYLTDIRLNQAKELLAASSLNIGEIAAVVGYENALYFSRIFREKFFHFSVELPCQSLIMCDNQCGFIQRRNDICHCKCLTRTGNSKQGLKLITLLKSLYQFCNRLRLVSCRLIF